MADGIAENKGELEQLGKEIMEYCKGVNIQVFLLRFPLTTKVEWNSKESGDFKAFLEIPQKNGIKVVYMYQGYLFQKEYERLNHGKEVVDVHLYYFYNNVIHKFLKVASWWKPPVTPDNLKMETSYR